MENSILTFLGTGSAFNASLKDTSCYIRSGDSLILVDAGGTVFHELIHKSILKGIKKLYIIITHTHPDHVGSLGDIIFYAHYIMNIKPVIYFPEKSILCSFLNSTGVQSTIYSLNSNLNSVIEDDNMGGMKLGFMRVSHADNIPCFGFMLKICGKVVYYSGDSRAIDEKIIDLLYEDKLHMLYQDTSGIDYKGSNHMSFNSLCSLIPRELRSKVCCIHHDEYITKDMVEKEGFLFA